MLHQLKRHPIPMAAHFRHCLVLTYALPREILQPLLPPGLQVDHYGDYGFVAAALVRAEQMRPRGLPSFLGRDFQLTGYRIFCGFQKPSGAVQRGLRILRSDCDSHIMACAGNRLTHYNYNVARISMTESEGHLAVSVTSHDGRADLDVTADLSRAAALPPGSIFPDIATARRFAGPLPFTFDYEPQTHSIVAIKGVRSQWDPRPVAVQVRQCSFIQQPIFQGAQPILSNAFYVDNISYSWNRGVVHQLPRTPPAGAK